MLVANLLNFKELTVAVVGGSNTAGAGVDHTDPSKI
jgi:hypothetical protein